jgi:predicted alpha/beta-hydrolase family hydrolase
LRVVVIVPGGSRGGRVSAIVAIFVVPVITVLLCAATYFYPFLFGKEF